MNYYERHLGDYARDTAHLSLLEHGAYTLLLDRYYVTEKPLPKDERELFRLLRATSKAEKDAIRQVLREFFTDGPDGWTQGRCDEEIARFQDKKRKAKASADARWSQSEGNAKAMRTHTKTDANALRAQSEGNALQSPVSIHQTPEKTQSAPPSFDGWAFVEQRMQPKYPKGLFKQPHWITASRAVESLVLEQGVDPELIASNVALYARECEANGTEARYVMSPARWLGEGYWKGPFTTAAPVGDSPEKIRLREAETREWAELTRRADASGFRSPTTGESMGAFRTLLQRHEDARREEGKRTTTGPASLASLLPTRATA